MSVDTGQPPAADCCYCQKPVGVEAHGVPGSLTGWAHPVCFWRARALDFESKMDRLMGHNPVYVARGAWLRIVERRLKVKDDALRLTQRNVEGTHDGGYVIRVTGAEMGAIRGAIDRDPLWECTCGVAGHLKGVDPSNTCQICGGHVRGLDRYYPGEEPPPPAKQGV